MILLWVVVTPHKIRKLNFLSTCYPTTMVEERKINDKMQWNIILQQEADAQFIEHLDGYSKQINKLTKKDYTPRDLNLSMISKIANDAEQGYVLYQMNETVYFFFFFRFLCFVFSLLLLRCFVSSFSDIFAGKRFKHLNRCGLRVVGPQNILLLK